MVDNKKIALDLASKISFVPTDDRILVKPLKPVMVTKLVPVPPKEQPKTLEEAEQQEPTQPEKRKVEANMQRGVIIKLGDDYQAESDIRHLGLEVGDVVIYPRMAGVAFELLKDSRLLRRYEVVALER